VRALQAQAQAPRPQEFVFVSSSGLRPRAARGGTRNKGRKSRWTTRKVGGQRRGGISQTMTVTKNRPLTLRLRANRPKNLGPLTLRLRANNINTNSTKLKYEMMDVLDKFILIYSNLLFILEDCFLNVR
jgi:hypothetical protein